jgi:hypothetical protein
MSIHHMMTKDYYGTPSYGYGTFVTMSSKRCAAEACCHSGAHFLGKSIEAVHDVSDRQWFEGTMVILWRYYSARGTGGQQAWHHRTIQIAMEHGMMIAEVNMAIGAIDRILKMIKDGKSNNRELTNARVELDHWRARLLKAVHKGTP